MRKWLAWMLCAYMMILPGCTAAGETANHTMETIDVEYKKSDLNAEWNANQAVLITFDGRQADITGGGAALSNGVLLITGEGDYVLSGHFEGRIHVDAGKKNDVRLILSGLTVTTDDSAAIFVLKADKATITLAEGTENVLLSGGRLLYEEDEELDAAIYSKADLVINGSGSLNVDSPYGHGILSKDDLRITGGSITVNSAKDGVRGRDAVQMAAGNVNVVAGEDGVKSNNDEDAELGYVSIDGGILNIAAGEDGIQAETVLQIRGGSVVVESGGGSGEAQMPEEKGWMGGWHRSDSSAADGGISAKGLKAGRTLFITGGAVDINSLDDSLHSDGGMLLSGGETVIKTGDDGAHAEETLIITGGRLHVTQSYEGLEALNLLIEGGDISVISTDDGLNAAGGSDDDSDWNRNPFAADDSMIQVTGGVLRVNAGGDGIDSNGTVRFEGGEVYVSGPTASMNGALDSNGQMTISGGVLFAAGAAGMASAPSAAGQAVTMLYLNTQPGGQTVSVKNASGEVLGEFTPEKEWESIVISLPGLNEGEEFGLYVGGHLAASAKAGDGAGSGGMMGGMHGGRGERGGRK